MCIIAIKKKGVKFPKVETIKTMCDNNPDGFAIVYHIKGQNVKCMRSLDSNDVYDLYRKLLKHSYRKVSFFMHARIKTHGTININNCHGWRSDDCKMHFAHNGVLSVKNRDDMTDSETFLRDIFTPAFVLGGWDSAKLTIDACIGTSKFVFMNDEGDIAHFGNYIEDDGMLFSNKTYEESRYPYGGSTYYREISVKHCPFKVGDTLVCNREYGLFKKGQQYKVSSLCKYGMNLYPIDNKKSPSMYVYQDCYTSFTHSTVNTRNTSDDAGVMIGDSLYLRKDYAAYPKGSEFVVRAIYKDDKSISVRPVNSKKTAILFTLDELYNFFSDEPIQDEIHFQEQDLIECMEDFYTSSGSFIKKGTIAVVCRVYPSGMSIETGFGYIWISIDRCNKFLLLDY